MKRALGIFFFLTMACLPAKAQVTPAWEIGAGFVLRDYYPPTASSRFATFGGDLTADRNFKRWIGLTIDASATYRNEGINNGQYGIYEFLAGPRIYPFTHRHKLVPYGQILFGLGYLDLHYPTHGAFNAVTDTNASLAWAGGGGVEWKWKKRWNIRLFEFDYEHTKFPLFPTGLGSYTEGNYRISMGLVYHIGGK